MLGNAGCPVAKLASFLVLAGIACLAKADSIDDYLRSEMQKRQIPEIAFAIVKNGQIVRSGASGLSDIPEKRLAKIDDLFEIGSLTKQFTSMAIMILVEAGRINLDDSISKYLSDAPPSWSPIKVRNLLNQDSGLPEYVSLPGLGLLDKFTRAQFIENLGKLPLDFPPEQAWAYSNTNYALLGWLIEDLIKEPYTKFVQENILRPLGMTHTIFSEGTGPVPGEARGYVIRRRALMPTPKGAASIKADGGLISNIPDLVKWDAALNDLRLLNRKSYQTIWTRTKLTSGRTHAYGMGWYLNQPGTKGYMGHSGNSAGYSAGISRFPGMKLSVILLSNLYPLPAEAMTKHIAELFDPTLSNPPFAPVPDPDPKLTEKIKLVIAALAEGKPDEALMEPELVLPMKTGRVKTASRSTWNQLKTVDSLTFGGSRVQGTDTVQVYRITSGTQSFIASFVWTPQNKVAQVSIYAEVVTPPAKPADGKG